MHELFVNLSDCEMNIRRCIKKSITVHLYIRKSFLGFVRIDIANQNELFKGLLPPPEVGGELVFDDEMPDPLQGRLHNLLGQPDGLQQILFSGLQEIHC